MSKLWGRLVCWYRNDCGAIWWWRHKDGVSWACIYDIKVRRSWTHVEVKG